MSDRLFDALVTLYIVLGIIVFCVIIVATIASVVAPAR